MSIPFIDLGAQRERIKTEIHAAVAEVVDSGAYIMGPPVKALEAALSEFSSAAHTISCANGTDALILALKAYGVKPGDAVFCPSFTFTATAEVVALIGATPVFVDIRPDTYNLDPDHLSASIKKIRDEGEYNPAAVIIVDLFGQMADYPALSRISKDNGLTMIADSAQSFGATLSGKMPLEWADILTTSFFPAKPLGCYGDGGAIQTNDAETAEVLLSLRNHGQATKKDLNGAETDHDPKYLNYRIGMNSRLDSIQAAVLIEKLKIFPGEIKDRVRIAERYNRTLKDLVTQTPRTIDDGVSVWAQYTIETRERDDLAAHLKTHGIPSAIYYPVPLHRQEPYRHYPQGPGGLPISEEKAGAVISLPMHAYLDEETQDKIVDAIRGFNGAR
ncbi:MAG: DegT/DnrJ/EryC1/StrS aminotransferase family protein [Marinicaulis sp.]|nr:DegT/DnrJ/EryC1/StrS aminotransferase family protein [Marinicaulis sp.]